MLNVFGQDSWFSNILKDTLKKKVIKLLSLLEWLQPVRCFFPAFPPRWPQRPSSARATRPWSGRAAPNSWSRSLPSSSRESGRSRERRLAQYQRCWSIRWGHAPSRRYSPPADKTRTRKIKIQNKHTGWFKIATDQNSYIFGQALVSYESYSTVWVKQKINWIEFQTFPANESNSSKFLTSKPTMWTLECWPAISLNSFA